MDQAIRDDGHGFVRVVDVDELGASAADPDDLMVKRGSVCLEEQFITADFGDPTETSQT